MKDLLKLKWSMHKGVNYIFYAIVIGLGILIGLGFKNFVLPNINVTVPVGLQEFLKSLVY